jgi:geranylgeranyl diphosphate synthase, type II
LSGAAWRRDLRAEQRLAIAALRRELQACRGIPSRLRAAMAHSLFGGGKRLRPVLVHWTFDALGGGHGRGHRRAVARDTVVRVGAAVEMIHTYSLIHDDLPAMDDDVLRRGRPTCHVAFDEATAILAGDGLQALAFAVLAGAGPRGAEMVAAAARAAGPAGMVGGQMRDLEAESRAVTAAAIRRIHAEKTAAMIGLSFALGGICHAAAPAQVARLDAAGRQLGLAFQGADDLLDTTSCREILGKTPGKDAARGKATWVRIEGPTAALARTRRHGRRGERELAALLPPGPAKDRLLALASYMWQRDR